MVSSFLIYTEDSNLKRRERKLRWSGGPSNSERPEPTEMGGEGRGLHCNPVNPLIRTNEYNQILSSIWFFLYIYKNYEPHTARNMW